MKIRIIPRNKMLFFPKSIDLTGLDVSIMDSKKRTVGENLHNNTSWVAEFLKKNSINNPNPRDDFSHFYGEMSLRKLCTYNLYKKIADNFTSYLEPLAGVGIDAKFFENDPAQTYVNDLDPDCLSVLHKNFTKTSSYDFFNPKQRAKLLTVNPDLIFLDFNNFKSPQLINGQYLSEVVDSFNATKKYVILNDCAMFYLRFGKKSYRTYSNLLGTEVRNDPEYFAALEDFYAKFVTGWHLKAVEDFYYPGGGKESTGIGASCYLLFSREASLLETHHNTIRDLKEPILNIEIERKPSGLERYCA